MAEDTGGGLCIRPIGDRDWQALGEIVASNRAGGFAGCDVPWPRDEAGLRAACAFFCPKRRIFLRGGERPAGNVPCG